MANFTIFVGLRLDERKEKQSAEKKDCEFIWSHPASDFFWLSSCSSKEGPKSGLHGPQNKEKTSPLNTCAEIIPAALDVLLFPTQLRNRKRSRGHFHGKKGIFV
jgi:hypothetical protein